MEEAIKYWCDTNIAILDNDSMIENKQGKLVYQDTTMCPKSHAYADVYKLDTGEYQVYMNYGYIVCKESYAYEIYLTSRKFRKLSGVVDYISFYSTNSRNKCGILIDYIIEIINTEPWRKIQLESTRKWKSPKYPKGTRAPNLSYCDKNLPLIRIIKEYNIFKVRYSS